MRRDIEALSNRSFDIVVIGGGILGAFVTWYAARRGYSVAMLEKSDFASGTTSASGKVVHGGIRYLQGPHFDLLKEAQKEQEAVARLAPRLVRPLSFLVPPAADSLLQNVRLTCAAWGWRTCRSLAGNGLDLGPTGVVKKKHRSEYGRWLKRLDRSRALLYGDLQLRSPERLVLALHHSSASMGAGIANYVEVTDIILSGNTVRGVRARDRLGQRDFDVKASLVVNAAGAWAPQLEAAFGTHQLGSTHFATGDHVVLDRPEPEIALAVAIPDGASTTLHSEAETRRIFIMPWEGRTLVGATYEPFRSEPDQCVPQPRRVHDLLKTVDRYWPGLDLSRNRPLYTYAGLYPAFDTKPDPEDGFRASLYPRIIDHRTEDDISGLISVVGVKLTTARSLAENILDRMDKQPGIEIRPSGASTSVNAPLELARPTPLPDPDQVTDDLLHERSSMEELVTLASRNEMARTLEDVLFRRTWIGHLGKPEDSWLREVAGMMGRQLGWSSDRTAREVATTQNLYDRRL